MISRKESQYKFPKAQSYSYQEHNRMLFQEFLVSSLSLKVCQTVDMIQRGTTPKSHPSHYNKLSIFNEATISSYLPPFETSHFEASC